MAFFKVCTKCLKRKEFFEFHASKRCSDGRVSRCKICIKEYSKKHYQENADNHKRYNEENQDLRKKYHKNYRVKNRVRKNAVQSFRLRTEPEFKIVANCRKRIWHALKSQSCKKNKRAIELLGCSIEFLKVYLENMFLPGMSWDNYTIDGWHIDHIKACANFDFKDEAQQKECFHYTNLQPLWAADNIRKSNNIVNY